MTSSSHSYSRSAGGTPRQHTAAVAARSSQRSIWFPLLFLVSTASTIFWHAGLIRTSNNHNSNDASAAIDVPGMTAATAEKQRLLEQRLAQMQESLDLLQQTLSVSATTSKTTLNGTTTIASETSRSLPSCRALMSARYSHFKDGDFLTSSEAHHIWIPRADGSRQLELTFPCTLHRYTAQEARTCLRGKHISLIGDSLSRYLFLTLAHFLQHGVWPPRFGQARGQFGIVNNANTKENQLQNICPHIDEQGKPTCSTLDKPNIAMEGDWQRLPGGQDSWETFLEQIGGATDGGIFNGHMECDCARSSRVGKRDLCKAECQVENELYISDPASDEGEWEEEESRHAKQNNDDDDIDYSQRVLLSHVKENGWGDPARNVSGFSFSKCGATGSCRRDQNTTNFMLERAIKGVFEWNEPLADALQNSLKKVLPPANIGIYNKGLWGPVSKETLSRVMPALYNFTGGEEGRCFFRSTTGSPKTLEQKLEEHERVLVKKHTLLHGCSFLDFGRLTEDFARIGYREGAGVDKSTASYMLQERNFIYWDVVHFLPWVYEELNNMLLNVLCNAQDGIK